MNLYDKPTFGFLGDYKAFDPNEECCPYLDEGIGDSGQEPDIMCKHAKGPKNTPTITREVSLHFCYLKWGCVFVNCVRWALVFRVHAWEI
jgi:hypothetical protein